jgi:hypothetical protein
MERTRREGAHEIQPVKHSNSKSSYLVRTMRIEFAQDLEFQLFLATPTTDYDY